MNRSDVIALAVKSGLRTEHGVSEFAYLDRLEMFVGLIEQHIASLPAAEDAQGWRPIETAPKGVAHVLLTDGERVFEGFFFGGKWLRAQNENLAFATHWQPLPAAPAMSQDSGKENGE